MAGNARVHLGTPLLIIIECSISFLVIFIQLLFAKTKQSLQI